MQEFADSSVVWPVNGTFDVVCGAQEGGRRRISTAVGDGGEEKAATERQDGLAGASRGGGRADKSVWLTTCKDLYCRRGTMGRMIAAVL